MIQTSIGRIGGIHGLDWIVLDDCKYPISN